VSESHQAQVNILEALTRNFRLDRDVDLCRIAEQCPFNYTGADFYALCSDAMLNAMSRKADFLESKIGRSMQKFLYFVINVLVSADINKLPESLGQHPYPMTPQYFLSELASADDLLVAVSQVDFDNALVTLVPSVTQAEMEHYARVQHHFSQGANI
jgi:peroxin-6